MAIRRFDADMNIIAKLDDEPNDIGGLTAAALKAKFDAAGLTVQHYINESLLPDMRAENLGFTTSAGVTAHTVQEAIEQVHRQLCNVSLGELPDGSIPPEKLIGSPRRFYRRFESSDWTGGGGSYQMVIPPEVHKLDGSSPVCLHQLHMLVGRNVEDFTPATLAEGQAKFIQALQAANTANQAMPGTYPTAADGHIVLTWYQIQYFLLSGTLVSAGPAQSQAGSMGYDWRDLPIQIPPEQVNSLDVLLQAAYTPMLGGSAANFNALFTLDTAHGLNLRRKADTTEPGAAATYDRVGTMVSNTWGCLETVISFGGDKVLRLVSETPYAGEILFLG
ncbi:MAG: hypothetical protein HFE97_07530 [Oscillospiraceae bacterium]|nr:hypothetical protein [Oscillospiraceae bacterium]